MRVRSTLSAMARAARAQRLLQTQCADAQQQKAGALTNAYGGGLDQTRGATAAARRNPQR